MRTIRHAACILVAAASVAVAAWQPVVAVDRADGEAAAPAGGATRVDERLPGTIDRAVLSAPLLKA